ncbi:uncharacterized protein LOC119271325 [Triticum dicoccoides]|uniref:uncharacterized protein LOC119271325 n=1 Tax=Triticum dicoccoides TaxID=85692 RepID=UPI00188E1EB9|nr:uncharacterized protein LOC119271325 [Triticum dicoccoides]
MSGGIRRFLNLGVHDGRNRAYSLRRLDLSKINFFHRTADEVAAQGKVLPTLTPAKASVPNRKRICNTNLAAAEAAAPKIKKAPASELVMRPPEVSSCLPGRHCVHFFPTASEKTFVLGDRANRMLRFDMGEHCRSIDTMPSLHEHKHSPLSITVPPSDSHLDDGEDCGDLYIIDRILHPDKSEVKPQFEALVWRAEHPRSFSSRSWHCDILPLPPWIIHQKHAYVYGHALVGDTICFSIAGAEGTGTYCFYIKTREWSTAGDWLIPFQGKAEYVPELGLWFGESQGLPCAADISGVLRGEEPLPEKMRIWANDDLPEEWQPSELCKSKVISVGSGRFIVADFLDSMIFDKDCNEMVTGKQFALFTGMEVVYGNGKNGNGANKDNDNYNSGNNGICKDNGNIGSKGKEMMRGLRMIKHKSIRYMFNKQLSIEAVL